MSVKLDMKLCILTVGSERPKLKDLYKHVTPCYAAQWEDIGVYLDAKQNHLGYKKSARPIRSNMQAGRCNQNALMSAEAKKLATLSTNF